MGQQYIEELDVESIATQSTDSLLEQLSLPIMETSIRNQISSTSNTSRDFLDTVLRKFRAIDENADTDSVRGIRSEMVDWAESLILAIVHQYDLGYDNPNEDSLESLDILEALYHFFVLERRENTTAFFIQYIDVHKKEIAEQMNLNTRSGDITTMANKKKNVPKYNVPILSNLDEVIKFIANSGVSAEEFLELIDDGNYYTALVHQYFDDGMLVGDFFSSYIENELGIYGEDTSMELRSAIRTHLSAI